MSSPIGANNNINSNASQAKPLFFARRDFIAIQRIIGLSLIAMGLLTLAFAPLTKGVAVVPAFLLMGTGSLIIGASLIQQVIGHAPECAHGRVKRAVAGAFIMLGGPIGWVVGGILWHLSNRDNRRIHKIS